MKRFSIRRKFRMALGCALLAANAAWAGEEPAPSPEPAAAVQEQAQPAQEQAQPAQEQAQPAQEQAQPAQEQAQPAQEQAQPKVFATVGDTVITLAEYYRAFNEAGRKKFYHGKPPPAEVAALQREVGDKLVNEALLLQEAQRRGMLADEQKVKENVEGFERRYAANARWQQIREKMLPEVARQYERADLLERIEKETREGAPEPSAEEERSYYQANLDKFTEPEQVKLSVILLKVDPSSPNSAWDKALEDGKELHRRLKAGEDFAELAKQHSGDASAQEGGEMPYLHKGMLSDELQVVVDKLQLGEFTEAFRVLQGIYILRLDSRKGNVRREFDEVRERLLGLLKRERAEEAWKALIARLRKETQFSVDESFYLPLPPPEEKGQEKAEGAPEEKGQEKTGGEGAGEQKQDMP